MRQDWFLYAFPPKLHFSVKSYLNSMPICSSVPQLRGPHNRLKNRVSSGRVFKSLNFSGASRRYNSGIHQFLYNFLCYFSAEFSHSKFVSTFFFTIPPQPIFVGFGRDISQCSITFFQFFSAPLTMDIIHSTVFAAGFLSFIFPFSPSSLATHFAFIEDSSQASF